MEHENSTRGARFIGIVCTDHQVVINEQMNTAARSLTNRAVVGDCMIKRFDCMIKRFKTMTQYRNSTNRLMGGTVHLLQFLGCLPTN